MSQKTPDQLARRRATQKKFYARHRQKILDRAKQRRAAWSEEQRVEYNRERAAYWREYLSRPGVREQIRARERANRAKKRAQVPAAEGAPRQIRVSADQAPAVQRPARLAAWIPLGGERDHST